MGGAIVCQPSHTSRSRFGSLRRRHHLGDVVDVQAVLRSAGWGTIALAVRGFEAGHDGRQLFGSFGSDGVAITSEVLSSVIIRRWSAGRSSLSNRVESFANFAMASMHCWLMRR